MKQFKNNVVKSFKVVKKDMTKIQNHIDDLTRTQEKLIRALKQSRENELKLFKKIEELKKIKIEEAKFKKDLKVGIYINHISNLRSSHVVIS